MKAEEHLNKKDNKTIDRLFKEKLEGMEYEVNLEAAVVHQYVQKYKRKKQLIFFWSITFSLLFMLPLISNSDTFNFDTQNVSTVNKNKPISTNDSTSKLNNIPSKQVSETKTHVESNKGSVPSKKTESFSLNNQVITKNKQKASTWQSINKEIDKNNAKLLSKESNKVKKYIVSYAQTNFNKYKGLQQRESKEKVQVKITLLPDINTKYPEYAPVINADGTVLFFTSRRPEVNSKKKRKTKIKETIYMATFSKSIKRFTTPNEAPYPLNKEETFASAVGVSNDGQQLFIYQDDETGNGDIYISKLKGNTWSDLEKLPSPINTKYLETTVSLSPDGNIMYIASNRPGGYGGLDLWYSIKNKDGTWQEPVNLGPDINTPGNEEGVYIHPDGKTLYFHSNGHGGFGGYDIFYSTFENGKWSKPVNMGEPINSPNHDVYFTIDAAKKIAYFASKRKGGKGETDIYQAIFTYPKKKAKISSLTLFKGKVLDKQTLQPLEAKIEIIDLLKNESINTLNSNAATGKFMVSLPTGKNYAINVNKEGYLFYSESFLLDTTADYNEVEKIIYLDKLVSGAKVRLNNIFYDYDKATLRPESKTELDKVYDLMQQNPNLVIEFSAHTDSRGSNAYNLALSQKRAQSCVDYLVGKGIDKNRLIAKGYGETQPVITDEEINKLTTEEEKEQAHQQNRRTEIKIIKN